MKSTIRNTQYAIRNTKRMAIILLVISSWLMLSHSECIAATLTITANNGSVTVTPDKAQYDYGELVQLIPRPETGYYFTGWAGDVQRKGLVLNITMDGNKTIIANFSAWQPPIGIPMPSFGIFETYRMYDDPVKRNPALTYSQNMEGGYYTHYIDMNDVNNSTDTNNVYGTIAKPRRTFPTVSTIIPGSVVEIHGGTYSILWALIVNGTEAQPIFVRGLATTRPVTERAIVVRGHYIIVENIDFNMNQRSESGVIVRSVTVSEEVHHVAVRNCEVHNSTGNGVYAVSYQAGIKVEDVVFYNNRIHPGNLVPPDVTAEPDNVGIGVLRNTNRIWIVDNHISHVAGDCVGSGHAANYTATNYYIGRNIMHDTSENAADFKETDTVILSENVMYNFAGGSSGQADGVALVVHYGPTYSPKNTWVLYNEIYNNNGCAIQVGGAQQYDVYIVGNIIHDIRNGIVAKYMFESFDEGGEFIFSKLLQKGYINQEGKVNEDFTSLDEEFKSWFPVGYDQFTYIEARLQKALNSGQTATGYRTWSSKKVYMLNNVFYNIDNGINSDVPGSEGILILQNNIISNISDTGYHISLINTLHRAAAEIGYNILYQPGSEARIVWGSLTYNVAQFQSTTGKGEGCLEADPLFVNPENNDFSLQAGSPAIDAGIEHSIYQLFQDTFGIDIRKDFEGRTRTEPWDIGAYEYAPQGAVLYGDVNGDGEITAFDAALAAHIAVDLEHPDIKNRAAADVSGDGEVTAYDAALIAQKAVGLIDRFPAEG